MDRPNRGTVRHVPTAVPAAGSSGRSISASELQQHATRDDCWTVIHGKVYDITSFLEAHPGGAKILLKYAGADSTRAFDMVSAWCAWCVRVCML